MALNDDALMSQAPYSRKQSNKQEKTHQQKQTWLLAAVAFTLLPPLPPFAADELAAVFPPFEAVELRAGPPPPPAAVDDGVDACTG